MSSTDHTPPTIMTQFTNSLLFDTETLSSVNKAYTNTSGDSLKSADQFISTIESCQGYIYTSGIGNHQCSILYLTPAYLTNCISIITCDDIKDTMLFVFMIGQLHVMFLYMYVLVL